MKTLSKQQLSKQQWAEDAFAALETALIEFSQEFINPTAEEKLELLSSVADIAGERHGITDEHLLDQAHDYAMGHIEQDLQQEEFENLHCGILFLMAYFDVLSFCKQMDSKEIEAAMLQLTHHYDLDIGI